MKESAYFYSLFLATGLVFIIHYIAWRRGFYRLPQPCLEAQTALGGYEVLAVFTIFIFLASLGMPIASFLWSLFNSTERNMATQGWWNVYTVCLSACGVMGTTFCLPKTARAAIWGAASQKGLDRILHDLLVGVGSWVICYPSVMLLNQLLSLFVIWLFHPSNAEQVAVTYLKMAKGYPILFTILALLLVLVVPFLEETLFRGCLQGWLRQQVGVPTAIVLSSGVFALFHFSESQGYENIALLISLFFLSCFLGYLYERQQSLWASIGLHGAFNGMSVLMLFAECG
jgi:membrane protease YdiL (CAAX protease family)